MDVIFETGYAGEEEGNIQVTYFRKDDSIDVVVGGERRNKPELAEKMFADLVLPALRRWRDRWKR